MGRARRGQTATLADVPARRGSAATVTLVSDEGPSVPVTPAPSGWSTEDAFQATFGSQRGLTPEGYWKALLHGDAQDRMLFLARLGQTFTDAQANEYAQALATADMAQLISQYQASTLIAGAGRNGHPVVCAAVDRMLVQAYAEDVPADLAPVNAQMLAFADSFPLAYEHKRDHFGVSDNELLLWAQAAESLEGPTQQELLHDMSRIITDEDTRMLLREVTEHRPACLHIQQQIVDRIAAGDENASVTAWKVLCAQDDWNKDLADNDESRDGSASQVNKILLQALTDAPAVVDARRITDQLRLLRRDGSPMQELAARDLTSTVRDFTELTRASTPDLEVSTVGNRQWLRAGGQVAAVADIMAQGAGALEETPAWTDLQEAVAENMSVRETHVFRQANISELGAVAQTRVADAQAKISEYAAHELRGFEERPSQLVHSYAVSTMAQTLADITARDAGGDVTRVFPDMAAEARRASDNYRTADETEPAPMTLLDRDGWEALYHDVLGNPDLMSSGLRAMRMNSRVFVAALDRQLALKLNKPPYYN